MTKIHQYTMLCAPITAQIAAIEALRHGEKYMKKMVAEYDRRRHLIYDGFTKMGLPCFEPKGAFYIFPDITSTGYTSDLSLIHILCNAYRVIRAGCQASP